jgi:AcrR family transcriptional regulator
MTDKTAGIAKAREDRSRQKRQAVEAALTRLHEDGAEITVKAVAQAAGVSRQYLYNNFGADLLQIRDESRHQVAIVEGLRVPRRTPQEHQHVEALLRRKIERLEEDLKGARDESRGLRREVEKALGRAEHYRQLYESLHAAKSRPNR